MYKLFQKMKVMIAFSVAVQTANTDTRLNIILEKRHRRAKYNNNNNNQDADDDHHHTHGIIFFIKTFTLRTPFLMKSCQYKTGTVV